MTDLQKSFGTFRVKLISQPVRVLLESPSSDSASFGRHTVSICPSCHMLVCGCVCMCVCVGHHTHQYLRFHSNWLGACSEAFQACCGMGCTSLCSAVTSDSKSLTVSHSYLQWKHTTLDWKYQISHASEATSMPVLSSACYRFNPICFSSVTELL